MKWFNVKLILLREVRDQLRDRRTLFMIAVLPLLLYPLLGMSFLQMSTFMKEKPTRVLVVGGRGLPESPPLFEDMENKRFATNLFSNADRADLLELEFAADEPDEDAATPDQQRAAARAAVQSGDFEAAVYFAPEFSGQLALFRQLVAERMARTPAEDGTQTMAESLLQVPSPEIIYTTAREKSQITYARLSEVLRRWTVEIGQQNLQERGVPRSATMPFEVTPADVADETGYQGAALWSKILPVLLLIWAMTGAFYPAIDLCAGEKERGTLETLLSSPAQRSEIVMGKLMTVMVFSAITAALNLLSIALTGCLVLVQIPQFGPPPISAVLWLSLALIPVSALFSALCLALAAFARSTKEGQYYLMPLLLVTMPLAIFPMAPSVELTLGNSLIPITGIVLLLRTLLAGDHWLALQYSPPVILVTCACCWASIRWAVDQFNSESVLFRESERLDVGLWLKHLIRDRRPTPTVAMAFFAGATILLIRFFMGFAMSMPATFGQFALIALVSQLVVILAPTVLMTTTLTLSPRKTLLLYRPRWTTIPAAALLALALHPTATLLRDLVVRLYPMGEEMAGLESALQGGTFWQLLLIIAVAPAICEELAFRGFVLSGLRHMGHRWRAIIISSLFFGLTHPMLQQSLVACLVGIVIGYIAVQTGSILPGMIYHMIHNGLGLELAYGQLSQWFAGTFPGLAAILDDLFGVLVVQSEGGAYQYHWSAVVLGGVCAVALLAWFRRVPHVMSPEEQLQQAIDRGVTDVGAGVDRGRPMVENA